MTSDLVSIILPVYNQADHIASIVQQHEERLQKLPHPHELLLVTNGCRDNSREICQQLEQDYKAVRWIDCQQAGWGMAVQEGLRAAQGQWLCYTNSARTSSQDLVLFVLYAVANPESVIKANRKIREGLTRRLGSLLYNLECRMFFDLAFWDINGTPKVFPRNYEKLLSLTRDDDLIDLEFNVICKQENYPMLEVPIFSTHRFGGISTTNYKSALRMYWRAFLMKLNMKEAL